MRRALHTWDEIQEIVLPMGGPSDEPDIPCIKFDYADHPFAINDPAGYPRAALIHARGQDAHVKEHYRYHSLHRKFVR